jgi:hypothetical protein
MRLEPSARAVSRRRADQFAYWTIVKGRQAIGEMFAGFCKDSKDGGLKRLRGGTQHADLGRVRDAIASAPFLAEPYRGSDAYITGDGYLKAMVSTFDAAALKVKK